MLFVVACSCSLLCHFLSNILSHVLVNDIGLYFEGSWGLFLSFGIRYMLAVFSASGIYPASAIAFSTRWVMFIAAFPPYLRLSAKIPSGPGAFPIGSSLMTC